MIPFFEFLRGVLALGPIIAFILPFFTFFLGGVAVFDGNRKVGAVGVSGLAGEVDERLANEAVEGTASL